MLQRALSCMHLLCSLMLVSFGLLGGVAFISGYFLVVDEPS